MIMEQIHWILADCYPNPNHADMHIEEMEMDQIILQIEAMQRMI